jgi:hypothetical protein
MACLTYRRSISARIEISMRPIGGSSVERIMPHLHRRRRLRPALALCLLAPLAACASAPRAPSGFLSSYDGLTPRTDTLRASIRESRKAEMISAVRKVAIEPAVFTPDADAAWMTPAERALLLREVDAQMCFELSERYDLVQPGAEDAHRVRTAVTAVRPTGRVASAASAAAAFFIPGPLGLRAPGTLGGLSAEAEMLSPSDQQVAAIAWTRTANAVGTDNPSLSRVGDALQFVEPFADSAAAAMTPQGLKPRRVSGTTDPCARFGPRFRAGGLAAKIGTGLYVPSLSGARAESGEPSPAQEP